MHFSPQFVLLVPFGSHSYVSIISLYSIHRLVALIEVNCILLEVGTEFLCVIEIYFRIQKADLCVSSYKLLPF